MDKFRENQIAVEIQNAYEKIDEKWLKMHFRTLYAIVPATIVIEAFIAVYLYRSGFVDMDRDWYLVKYLLAPAAANLVLLGLGVKMERSAQLKTKTKAYAASLILVVICFVFYTVHSIFNVLYAIFIAPILLTIVYGDYRLTGATAVSSLVAKVVSELFVVWDPDKLHPLESQAGLTNFLLSTLFLLVVTFIVLVAVRYEAEKNQAAVEKELAHYEDRQRLLVDELTNTFNRRALRETFHEMLDERNHQDYAVAMLDLDHLKHLNDSQGHVMGDKLLKEVGRILRRNCIDRGQAFRFGGDEFFLVFGKSSLEDAVMICEAIQADFRKSPLNQNLKKPLTMSMGVTKYEQGMSPQQLLRESDWALYKAKEMRDAIHVYQTGEMTEFAGESVS